VEGKDAAFKAKSSTEAFQAQESSGSSNTAAGTAGAAGCPEHNAPEQGRGNGGRGRSSDGPDRPWIKGSSGDESRSESVRDVTRCEQPASATVGAIIPTTRSVKKAPAGKGAGWLKVKVLIMTPGSGEHGPYGSGSACRGYG
jgi:hypothetical protein